MAKIDVDISEWPLAIVNFPKEYSDSEMQEYLEFMKTLRRRGEKYAVVVNAINLMRMTPTQRRMQAEFMATDVELVKKYIKATIFAIDSPIRRGLLTAIFWIQRPPNFHKVVSTLEQAKQLAREKLAAG